VGGGVSKSGSGTVGWVGSGGAEEDVVVTATAALAAVAEAAVVVALRGVEAVL
jgi:hypothetical protein